MAICGAMLTFLAVSVSYAAEKCPPRSIADLQQRWATEDLARAVQQNTWAIEDDRWRKDQEEHARKKSEVLSAIDDRIQEEASARARGDRKLSENYQQQIAQLRSALKRSEAAHAELEAVHAENGRSREELRASWREDMDARTALLQQHTAALERCRSKQPKKKTQRRAPNSPGVPRGE